MALQPFQNFNHISILLYWLHYSLNYVLIRAIFNDLNSFMRLLSHRFPYSNTNFTSSFTFGSSFTRWDTTCLFGAAISCNRYWGMLLHYNSCWVLASLLTLINLRGHLTHITRRITSLFRNSHIPTSLLFVFYQSNLTLGLSTREWRFSWQYTRK